MKNYGIIAAMQEEMQEIQKIMKNIQKIEIYGLNFIKGEINDKLVVLVEAGVGKVNATRTAQLLIDKFDEIENQNISSTNSKKYYETTSRTFNEINIVFKKFLNVLYESDMTDANVEIKVLNSMLKADGFDDSEINILRKEDSDE